MSPSQMRKALIGLYSGPSWQRWVERMPDNQVAAIYQRKLSAGAFNK